MSRYQRGAITVFAATLLMAVLIVALALDLGRTFVEQRTLQGAADAAAVAAARVLAEGGDATAAAQEAAVQNGYEGDLSQPGAVILGHIDFAAGKRQFQATAPYNAVRILAAKTIPKSLVAGGVLEGTTTLTATAIAHQDPIGGIRVGSFLATVDADQSALLNPLVGDLLGGTVALDAVGYNGLIGSRITLRELQAALGVATMDELLTAEVGLGEFLAIAADILEAQGNLASLQLDQLAAAALATPGEFTLGDLLAVSSDAESALDAGINVFDLVMASAQLIHQDETGAVSPITVDLNTAGSVLSELGLADLKMDLRIIEAPQIAVGRPGWDAEKGDWYTRARTGQVELAVHLTALEVDLGVLKTEVKLDLLLEAAQADAWLQTIYPATPLDPVHRADVGVQTTAARLAIGKKNAAGALTPTELLRVTVLGIPVSATAKADAAIGAPFPTTLSFAGPFVPVLTVPSDDNTQRVGSELEPALLGAATSLLDTLEIEVNVGPLSIGGQLTSALGDLIAPLVGNLAPSLLEPVLQSLGIQLGGADVTVIHLAPGQPRLMH